MVSSCYYQRKPTQKKKDPKDVSTLNKIEMNGRGSCSIPLQMHIPIQIPDGVKHSQTILITAVKSIVRVNIVFSVLSFCGYKFSARNYGTCRCDVADAAPNEKSKTKPKATPRGRQGE